MAVHDDGDVRAGVVRGRGAAASKAAPSADVTLGPGSGSGAPGFLFGTGHAPGTSECPGLDPGPRRRLRQLLPARPHRSSPRPDPVLRPGQK